MHRSTLSRSFSRDTGITLKKYISHQLQLQAALLLRESRLSIKEIARKLNFNDEYYFSHFFKRESGVSPGSSGSRSSKRPPINLPGGTPESVPRARFPSLLPKSVHIH
ncbi:MAG: helix-turn-helix domain-containing protein [Lentisphaeria bacterium]|nr:MAG: helix-turn-helix domain-containing protein [Lentisphaeria bacterium]